MSDDASDEQTNPGTPGALAAYRTKSGSLRIPEGELDRVFEALVKTQIRVLQERVHVLEMRLAALEANAPPAPPTGVRHEVCRLSPHDPRREP